MDTYKSNLVINAEEFDMFRDDIAYRQKVALSDSVFSIPENEWHSIRWYTKLDVKKASNSDFNVLSTITLEMSDPLEVENMLQKKLMRVCARLAKIEGLCLDMYKAVLEHSDDESWTGHMISLGLINENGHVTS